MQFHSRALLRIIGKIARACASDSNDQLALLLLCFASPLRKNPLELLPLVRCRTSLQEYFTPTRYSSSPREC